ncbi:MAG: amino acid ABC transporter permease [Coriobacteriia bacterium]|nr:amino acid ABC transporter permease [Coriobacteriia bacterium]
MQTIQQGFYQTFIYQDNYTYFLNGIVVTLEVAALACILGLILGVLAAIIRSAHDQQQPGRRKNPILGFFNAVAVVYITVIRGTPTMVQLLIMWFVVWASARATQPNMIACAVVTFGLNSGAYVAEIVRSGIMSVDSGQMEAGRSLGLSYATTMRCVIIPQAFKNILPALGNEAITLMKETSIVTVIGLKDLTKGAMIIQGNTFQALIPFVAIALIYLALVMILSFVFGAIERRLRQSDYR